MGRNNAYLNLEACTVLDISYIRYLLEGQVEIQITWLYELAAQRIGKG